MNKKCQAAMDFLMTYGWAILVVFAVIGYLAHYGILSPDRILPEKFITDIHFDYFNELTKSWHAKTGELIIKIR